MKRVRRPTAALPSVRRSNTELVRILRPYCRIGVKDANNHGPTSCSRLASASFNSNASEQPARLASFFS